MVSARYVMMEVVVLVVFLSLAAKWPSAEALNMDAKKITTSAPGKMTIKISGEYASTTTELISSDVVTLESNSTDIRDSRFFGLGNANSPWQKCNFTAYLEDLNATALPDLQDPNTTSIYEATSTPSRNSKFFGLGDGNSAWKKCNFTAYLEDLNSTVLPDLQDPNTTIYEAASTPSSRFPKFFGLGDSSSAWKKCNFTAYLEDINATVLPDLQDLNTTLYEATSTPSSRNPKFFGLGDGNSAWKKCNFTAYLEDLNATVLPDLQDPNTTSIYRNPKFFGLGDDNSPWQKCNFTTFLEDLNSTVLPDLQDSNTTDLYEETSIPSRNPKFFGLGDSNSPWQKCNFTAFLEDINATVLSDLQDSNTTSIYEATSALSRNPKFFGLGDSSSAWKKCNFSAYRSDPGTELFDQDYDTNETNDVGLDSELLQRNATIPSAENATTQENSDRQLRFFGLGDSNSAWKRCNWSEAFEQAYDSSDFIFETSTMPSTTPIREPRFFGLGDNSSSWHSCNLTLVRELMAQLALSTPLTLEDSESLYLDLSDTNSSSSYEDKESTQNPNSSSTNSSDYSITEESQAYEINDSSNGLNSNTATFVSRKSEDNLDVPLGNLPPLNYKLGSLPHSGVFMESAPLFPNQEHVDRIPSFLFPSKPTKAHSTNFDSAVFRVNLAPVLPEIETIEQRNPECPREASCPEWVLRKRTPNCKEDQDCPAPKKCCLQNCQLRCIFTSRPLPRPNRS